MSRKNRRLSGGVGRPVPVLAPYSRPSPGAKVDPFAHLKEEVKEVSTPTNGKHVEAPPSVPVPSVPPVPVVPPVPISSADKKRATRLPVAVKMKAVRWLTENWETLKHEKFTATVLCDRLMAHLKIEGVTPRGVQNLCKEADLNLFDIITVNSRRGRGPGPKGSGPNGTTRKLATQLANTQDIVKIICIRLGIPFDPDRTLKTEWLRLYAGGKANADEDYHFG